MRFFDWLFKRNTALDAPFVQEIKEEAPANATNHNQDIFLERRDNSLKICSQFGYAVANSLPYINDNSLRPVDEIAVRLHCICIAAMWAWTGESQVPSEFIHKFIEHNRLKEHFNETEQTIFSKDRSDKSELMNLGWTFENAWPLAWFFGYETPDYSGEQMAGEKMMEIIKNYTCIPDLDIHEWTKKQQTRSEEEVLQLEDTFYCMHNAVVSAQLRRETVSYTFDPLLNGGCIVERRHSLTWMVSPDTDWDEVSLDT